MLKFLLIVSLIFCLLFQVKILEKWERQNETLFWGTVIFVYATFTILDVKGNQISASPIETSSQILAAETITRGGSDERNNFVPPNVPPTNTGPSDSQNAKTYDETENNRGPKRIQFFRGLPSSAGSNNNGQTGDDGTIDKNQVPNDCDWILDSETWDGSQEEAEEEVVTPPGKLESDVDFPYTYDDDGHPDLLVPNTGLARENNKSTTVAFEQTASHMHHAEELGIPLPSNWDAKKYLAMDRADRVNYAIEHAGPDLITKVQNQIGRSMSPIFGIPGTTQKVIGKAGTNQVPTQLNIQRQGKDKNVLSITRLRDGKHISSFVLSDSRVVDLVQDDFWVLKGQNTIY